MLQIKNVSKSYQDHLVLRNVSLHLGQGLQFITGASGSGKTTLLNIISGLDQEYEGEVTYDGKNLKNLTDDEKSHYYHTVFGFIWQDFHLLEDHSVIENVLLPTYLQSEDTQKKAKKILKELNILTLEHKKVKYLSGGQKQRVAIARELMKDPKVFIADEPTSALDQQSSTEVMKLFHLLAKSRCVIIVTHDTSLLDEKSAIITLEKGEVSITSSTNTTRKITSGHHSSKALSFLDALKLGANNWKHKPSRFCISSLILILSSFLLLTTCSGAIVDNSEKEFDKLYQTYGDSLTDIGLYNSFIDAAGTDGEDGKKPSGDVNQDISSLFDRYAKDERVSFLAYLQAFNDINITIDGKQYQIKSSGNMPTINNLVAGKMPMGDGKEVVVPESFVKSLGLRKEDAIGKELLFQGSVFEWKDGTPISVRTSTTVRIVGVMDTTVYFEYAGQRSTYTVDDSFLFSRTALQELGSPVGLDVSNMNFLLRAKTPEAMIQIKDELQEEGIVPIGRFELVEDMVRLHQQTATQSGSATIIIAIIAVVMLIAVFFMSASLRKKEIAIYKVSGYRRKDINILLFSETFVLTFISSLIFLLTSPLFNMISTQLFSMSILQGPSLMVGVGIILCNAFLTFLISQCTLRKLSIKLALHTGDHA